ncbi:MAG: carboxypeptidase-like regulatory domain-containing protein [Candidatus Omnitrophota bacterium]
MNGKFNLQVPLDASGVEGFDPNQPVKVVVKDQDGKTYSQTVKLSKDGKGEAKFELDKAPGSLQVLAGPPDASDQEMEGLQTLSVTLSPRLWAGKNEFKATPIRIPSYYWHWWPIWCRWFTIRGRVLCANGNPVPGATVCAYDMDWWWWWSSRQEVGCAVTDQNGTFEIKFRWCCGWWPWWWWRSRLWNLDPQMIDRLLPLIHRVPGLENIPTPGPRPDLAAFENILKEDVAGIKIPAIGSLNRLNIVPPRLPESNTMALDASGANIPVPPDLQPRPEMIGPINFRGPINPDVLPTLQERLLKKLPASAEMARLRIWPWYPWFPWRDCAPDIIFRVTQPCGESLPRVIVDEGLLDVRWDIPTLLNITLFADKDACCIDHPPDPAGNCLNITFACDDSVTTIGGNLGAPASPIGYVNPGLHSVAGDRPYAGVIPIHGDFGATADADYYEFEWFNSATSLWEPLPAGSISGFNRLYFGPQLPAQVGPSHIYSAPFPVEFIDGKNVIKTRHYFETLNSFNEGLTHFWMTGRDMLINWYTQNYFENGTYRLRVKTYKLVGGHLQNATVLPQCGLNTDNALVLTVDNRVETAGPTDLNGHKCGAGTVHQCTSEPEAHFLSVKIIREGVGHDITPCSNFKITDTDVLQIDFVAHDPAGHLSYYTLNATYGEDLSRNLLTLGGVLTPSPIPPVWAPAAAQVGPGYDSALGQGAMSPVWNGGAIRLTVNAKLAFPETCCYQLELWSHKRTIVNCDHSLWGHTNTSEYSFLIEV